MMLPAVDAATGEPVIFTRDSGVALVDAVAASCAVPGIWPPVTIGDRRYIDGGIRSITNADLAAGSDRVLVIIPALEGQPEPFGRLDDEIESLRPGQALVVYADQASAAAFGTNPLSPLTRPPAAGRAGRSGWPRRPRWPRSGARSARSGQSARRHSRRRPAAGVSAVRARS